jgi:hypothetical protein
VWQLREDVLRRPLGLSLKNESLAMDYEDVILVALSGATVIGCLMLHPLPGSVMKFRQMAVSDSWQGRHIGRMLMEAGEQLAAEKNYTMVSLHARKIVAGFYSRLGYTTIGGEFTEVGIPHLKMEKQLQKSSV